MMKISKSVLAVAALSLASVGAQAATQDWFAHDPVEVAAGLKLPGSFVDYFTFTLSPSTTVTSSAVLLNNGTAINIQNASYSLWSGDGEGSGVDTWIASFNLDGTTGNSFNSVALTSGSYFYKVTGDVTGSFGGLYTLTSTLPPVAAPIPEPGTYAMLLAGLGAVGFMARRRKSI